MMDSTELGVSSCCLGATCLEWGCDGELAHYDLSLVLECLSRVDRHLEDAQKDDSQSAEALAFQDRGIAHGC